MSLPQAWHKHIGDELDAPYMHQLHNFLEQEQQKYTVYPKNKDIFRALNLADDPSQVKVVILGQDPYHGAGQATGLAFAVNEGIKLPPSLQNIWKEIHTSLGCNVQKDSDGNPIGSLDGWARQDVLLLNTSLTVRAHEAASHSKMGWEKFTDKIIETVSHAAPHCVFLLWGKHAQTKCPLIDMHKHTVLESVHPSPLSAYRGFFGSNHFQLANDWLISHAIKPIDWCDHV